MKAALTPEGPSHHTGLSLELERGFSKFFNLQLMAKLYYKPHLPALWGCASVVNLPQTYVLLNNISVATHDS